MFKRFASVFLALIMVLGIFPIGVLAETAVTDIRDSLHSAHSFLPQEVRHKDCDAHCNVGMGVPFRLFCDG